MSTVVVWVLFLSMGGPPAVIDNIASREDCEAAAHIILAHPDVTPRGSNYTCVAVKKVK